MTLPRNVIYYGLESPQPSRTIVHAGPLAMMFEAGDLRYIRLGDREVLRRVYMAVRDRNWGTPAARLSNLRKEIKDDSFRISYDAETVQNEIDFAWQGTISGEADGTVTFRMQGESRSTFL
jgi:D-apionolactonase